MIKWLVGHGITAKRHALTLRSGRFERDVHAQVQSDLVELGADFLEGGLAEVADIQELFFAAADQVPDGGDAFAFQAVGGADGQLELGQLISSLRSSSASIGMC